MEIDITSLRHILVPINDVDINEWNEFLFRCSESTYYCAFDHWSGFRNSFLIQTRNSENELIAGIPFRIETLVPLPALGKFFKFCRSDSSVLVDQTKIEGNINLYKAATFRYLFNIIKSKRVIIYQISPLTRSHDSELLSKLGFSIDRCATFIIDLDNDINNIFRAFSKGHRSAIKKATKMGVEAKILEGQEALSYVPEYCKMQNKLFEHKQGSYSKVYSKSEAYIKTILSSKFNKTFIAIAHYNNQPAAMAILMLFNENLSWYLGVSDYNLVKESKAANFLQYEIIRFAKNSGYKSYDMGGIPYVADPSISTYGVYTFKKGFGGERYEYDDGSYVLKKSRYNFIKILMKYQDHRFAQWLYRLFKTV